MVRGQEPLDMDVFQLQEKYANNILLDKSFEIGKIDTCMYVFCLYQQLDMTYSHDLKIVRHCLLQLISGDPILLPNQHIVGANFQALWMSEVLHACVTFTATADKWTLRGWRFLFLQFGILVSDVFHTEMRSTIDYDDVIKWKHLPRYWPFVRGIHRSPVNSPHKGQWRGALMFSLIYVWINAWAKNRYAGDLRRHQVHYGVNVMYQASIC